MDLLIAVLGGSSVAAIINQVGNYISARKTHEEKTETEEDEDIQILKEAMKILLLDRIRYLGQVYIKAQEVDFDERRILCAMYNTYKGPLKGGNDLDALMDEVNKLPLKIKK